MKSESQTNKISYPHSLHFTERAWILDLIHSLLIVNEIPGLLLFQNLGKNGLCEEQIIDFRGRRPL